MKVVYAFQHKDSKYDEYLGQELSYKFIKWWTKSKYYHVEVIVDNNWIGATRKGIHINELRPLNHEKYDYINLGDITLLESQKIKIKDYIQAIAKEGYDWTGLTFSQFLSIGIDRKGRKNCSELGTKLAQLFYVTKTLHLQPHKTNPQELYEALC